MLATACCAGPLPARTSPATADARALGAAAAAAWPDRLEPARLAVVLEPLRKAAALAPGDPEIELPLARAEAFRALAAEAPDEQRSGHDASARAAERALRRLAPRFAEAIDAGRPAAEAAALVEAGGAEPLYWLALGRMGAAQATGHTAVLAVRRPVMALMERAADLDERVDAGGPLRALGAWAAMLPSAAGGGLARSRERLARAAALFPDEPFRRLAEATGPALLTQDAAAFDRLVGEVLALAPEADPARAPELSLAQRRARALLDKRGRLF
jgi:hypothetical protein